MLLFLWAGYIMILLAILTYYTLAMIHLLLYVMLYGYPDKQDDLSLDIFWYSVVFWPIVWGILTYMCIFHTRLMFELMKREDSD